MITSHNSTSLYILSLWVLLKINAKKKYFRDIQGETPKRNKGEVKSIDKEGLKATGRSEESQARAQFCESLAQVDVRSLDIVHWTEYLCEEEEANARTHLALCSVIGQRGW